MTKQEICQMVPSPELDLAVAQVCGYINDLCGEHDFMDMNRGGWGRFSRDIADANKALSTADICPLKVSRFKDVQGRESWLYNWCQTSSTTCNHCDMRYVCDNPDKEVVTETQAEGIAKTILLRALEQEANQLISVGILDGNRP